jgi:hypothetical protein
MIHNMDLDSLLGAIKRSLSERQINVTYEFYHACLDRINHLIMERHAKVGKNEILNILR